MRKTMVALAALAALSAGAGSGAAGDAPGRYEVTETIVIAASPDKVWKILGDVEDSNWMQNVDTTLEQGGDPASSTRTLTLKNGHTLVVNGRQHDPERRSLAYSITENDADDLPADDFSATVAVEPDGADRSKVAWIARFSRGAADVDAAGADADPEKAVRSWMHGGLENLKSKVEKQRS